MSKESLLDQFLERSLTWLSFQWIFRLFAYFMPFYVESCKLKSILLTFVRFFYRVWNCSNFECLNWNIQLRDLAIKHLKYWFRISSILERTKNSTKTNNTSFERSDSGLLKSWRLGAWHSYWPATPTLYDKLNFLGEEGVASPWCCHAPVLQEFYCPLSGLSNEILYVFVPFLLFQ